MATLKGMRTVLLASIFALTPVTYSDCAGECPCITSIEPEAERAPAHPTIEEADEDGGAGGSTAEP